MNNIGKKVFINRVKANELFDEIINDVFSNNHCDNQYEGEFFEDEDEEKEQMKLPPRAQICEEAAKLINGDRNKSYGDPAINLKAAQLMQNSFLDSYFEAGKDICPEDEAWLNAMQNVFIKLGRIATGEFKKDSYADCIGYLGIAYELALRAQQEKESRDE